MVRIIEVIPGKDGVSRTARVKTQNGVLLRPVQRLYPLEMSSAEEADTAANKLLANSVVSPVAAEHRESDCHHEDKAKPTAEVTVTRLGRKVNKPKRLED